VSKAWFQQRERGSPLMIGIILWVAQHIGRPVARLLLWPITLYFLLTAGPARRASRDYLTRIQGHPASLWQVARHIHTFSATILDRVFFLSGQFDLFDFRLYGFEELNQQQGRGVILLGAHLGSFEVLRVLALKYSRMPTRVLMYVDHNQYLTRLFSRLNPAVAESVIALGGPDALLKAKQALDDGMVVGMLGDRVAQSEKLTRCRFLGEEAEFPAGPALLASVLQAPVVMAFGLYRGGNRYDLHLETLPTPPACGRQGREEMVAEWTSLYAARLEHYARLAPYNWFNFYDYWQDKK
jgi:predicted LPLAT superfamily acyltransferase